jgi:hypothetical protein
VNVKHEAWLVDVARNEDVLAHKIIPADSDDEVITKADEWARAKCQETGEALLIVRRPGEPGSIHSKRFDPFER